MRLAGFSDVHGNSIALDAVTADIAASGGVDGYLVLGDLAMGAHTGRWTARSTPSAC